MFIIDTILQLATTVFNKVVPDKTKQQEEQFQLLMQSTLAESDLAKKQIDVNIAEASNSNVWVAGARPAIMWVCAAAFAWQFVLQPFISYFVILAGHPIPPLPVLDSEALNTVLYGLLGLGGLRTFEKVKGVTK